MNRVQRHKEICKQLNKIYEQKNSDYGNSFGETFEKLGIISAITRISDKYNRICSLATKSAEERKVKDESIRDTLLDLANYCIMTVIEIENEREKECECVSAPIEAEITKAKWITSNGVIHCSNCGYQTLSLPRSISCPNCSAIMEKE